MIIKIFNIIDPDVVFKAEYLWNGWIKKDGVNANLAFAICLTLDTTIDFAFSSRLILLLNRTTWLLKMELYNIIWTIFFFLGVIILFGMGIILKDGLTFISYLMVDTSVCIDNNIKIAVSVFQALYIMAQTKYIFKFSKAYIRNCNGGSRYGFVSFSLFTMLRFCH